MTTSTVMLCDAVDHQYASNTKVCYIAHEQSDGNDMGHIHDLVQIIPMAVDAMKPSREYHKYPIALPWCCHEREADGTQKINWCPSIFMSDHEKSGLKIKCLTWHYHDTGSRLPWAPWYAP